MDELQNQQNQQAPQEPQKENFINKKVIVIIAVIIVLLIIGLGVYIFRFEIFNKRSPAMPYDMLPYKSVETPSISKTPQDTTSAIDNDLNSINVESIDDSFKEIDTDLNNL